MSSTTNFTKFKERIEAAKNKESQKKASAFNWLKLENGQKKVLRFLPLKNENLELPFTEQHFHSLTFPDGHYEQIVCPRKVDEDRDCPFCNYATKQYRKYKDTEKVEYKELFKQLAAKEQYLLVGYSVNEVDPANLKPDDCLIFKASSQANKESIVNKVLKEVDFIDFSIGRNVEISKTRPSGKAAYSTISIDFEDPSQAFPGNNGKQVWDQLVQLSPDLTKLVTPLSDKEIQDKFNEFVANPTEVDEETELLHNTESMRVIPTIETKVDEPDATLDLEALRKSMEDDD
jgi:hypothetical protein